MTIKKNDIYEITQIFENINKIEDYMEGIDFDSFVNDDKRMDAVLFRLIQTVEHINRISDAFKKSHRLIPWHLITGFRNRIVHEYGNSIDKYVVFETAKNGISVLKESLSDVRITSAAFFDLDGTLVDTIPDICAAINYTLEKVGLDKRFDNASTVALLNNGTDVIVKRALGNKADDPALFKKALDIYVARYKEYFCAKSVPMPGIAEVLKALKEKGVRLFVFTNKPTSIAVPLLIKLFGSGMFEDVRGQDFINPKKPDPTVYFQMLEQAGLKKEETIYVGDSNVDVELAKNAGVESAIITYGFCDYSKPWVKEATYVLSSSKELLNLFE